MIVKDPNSFSLVALPFLTQGFLRMVPAGCSGLCPEVLFQPLYQPDWAAPSKYHTLCSLNNRKSFSHSSGSSTVQHEGSGRVWFLAKTLFLAHSQPPPHCVLRCGGGEDTFWCLSFFKKKIFVDWF